MREGLRLFLQLTNHSIANESGVGVETGKEWDEQSARRFGRSLAGLREQHRHG